MFSWKPAGAWLGFPALVRSSTCGPLNCVDFHKSWKSAGNKQLFQFRSAQAQGRSKSNKRTFFWSSSGHTFVGTHHKINGMTFKRSPKLAQNLNCLNKMWRELEWMPYLCPRFFLCYCCKKVSKTPTSWKISLFVRIFWVFLFLHNYELYGLFVQV